MSAAGWASCICAARRSCTCVSRRRPSWKRNIESTQRQYGLVERAVELGFSREQVVVIDEDLGVSGSGLKDRSGFARLTAEVALGHAGLVLGLEVSRLARNKAARGELRRRLPVGLVWGERDGEILLDPDEAVSGVIGSIFARFAELSSARAVWLWLRSEGLAFPLAATSLVEARWVQPTYHQVLGVLANPIYAGAFVYGRTRVERYVDADGRPRQQIRRLAQADWEVLIEDHHRGYIDWPTFEANQQRIGGNTWRGADSAGAVREGQALL